MMSRTTESRTRHIFGQYKKREKAYDRHVLHTMRLCMLVTRRNMHATALKVKLRDLDIKLAIRHPRQDGVDTFATHKCETNPVCT